VILTGLKVGHPAPSGDRHDLHCFCRNATSGRGSVVAPEAGWRVL